MIHIYITTLEDQNNELQTASLLIAYSIAVQAVRFDIIGNLAAMLGSSFAALLLCSTTAANSTPKNAAQVIWDIAVCCEKMGCIALISPVHSSVYRSMCNEAGTIVAAARVYLKDCSGPRNQYIIGISGSGAR